MWENWASYFLFNLKKYSIYLFLKGREKEREKNINVWLPLQNPNWGPGPQLRHVPWLGIESLTLWFSVQHSIHWSTPARAENWLVIIFFTHTHEAFINYLLQIKKKWFQVLLFTFFTITSNKYALHFHFSFICVFLRILKHVFILF